MDKHTIGEQIRYLRMNKNVKQEKLIRGLCSRTAYSRIENGEKDFDYFLGMALLSRLGYSSDKVEAVLEDETYRRYMEREMIKDVFAKKDVQQLTELLDDFERSLTEEDILHKQFLLMYRAKTEHLKKNGSLEKELQYNKRALAMTDGLDGLEESEILYFTTDEVQLIIEIARLEEEMGREKEAEQKLKKLLVYMDIQIYDEEEKVKSYSSALLQYGNILYKKEMYTDVLNICKRGIDVLKRNTRILDDVYVELLLLKVKAMELLSEVEQQDCKVIYYTIYSMLSLYPERKKQQEEIKKLIEERYGWEYII